MSSFGRLSRYDLAAERVNPTGTTLSTRHINLEVIMDMYQQLTGGLCVWKPLKWHMTWLNEYYLSARTLIRVPRRQLSADYCQSLSVVK